jgi:adenosylhomocysteine nucleosidase
LIALLCATPVEMQCASSLLDEVEERYCPKGMKLLAGRSGDSEVILLAAGIGKAAAAAGSMFLIDNYAPEALIDYGIAGALSKELKVGEVIIADELIQGDLGVVHSKGFKMTGPGLHREEGLSFCPRHAVSAGLLSRCLDVAQSVAFPCRRGRIVTCDQILLDPKLRRELAVLFGALAVDMEGAAAAQVAASRDIDFIDVRGISDGVSFDLVGLEKLLPIEGETRTHISGKRLWLLLTHPSLVVGIRELGKGRTAALHNLSAFLELLLAGKPV